MAHNRMFLVYRPTGDAVFIGKRMSFGWHCEVDNLQHQIEELFRKAEDAAVDGNFSQDDFAIALESGENQPHVISKWNYPKHEPGNLTHLDIDGTVPYGTHEKI